MNNINGDNKLLEGTNPVQNFINFVGIAEDVEDEDILVPKVVIYFNVEVAVNEPDNVKN